MYNLLVFIKKYNAVLLFLLLEIICILLILINLPYHNRKMVNFSNNVAGGVLKTSSNISSYFNLRSENELLAQHNALLMNELKRLQLSNDSSWHDQKFEYIPAHVIRNNIYQVNNYIVIDKGSSDGVEPDMGVIGDNGVVGKVLNVSKHYASVMSLLNTFSVTSARFTDNQYIASVTWNNDGYQFGTVKDIPAHLVIIKGDTLVTSGLSNALPAETLIGTIEETYANDGGDFKTAKIRFSTNFNTLQHVYLVKNLYKDEIDSLCITH